MYKKIAGLLIILSIIISVLNYSAYARENVNKNLNAVDDDFFYCLTVHNIGNLVMNTSGIGFGELGSMEYAKDCYNIGGNPLRSNEFPKHSGINFINVSELWFGGIKNTDTMVTRSLNTELQNEIDTYYRSTLDPESPYYIGAISEQDYVAIASDTFPEIEVQWVNPSNKYPHRPMGIKVRQESYGWSYDYAGDFVMFNIMISNISRDKIHEFYLSIVIEHSIKYEYSPNEYGADDITGFNIIGTDISSCPLPDSTSLLWFADNDGDPYEGQFIDIPKFIPPGSYLKSCTGVNGIFFLDYPYTFNPQLSFNWWYGYEPRIPYSHSFGPQTKAKARRYDPYGTGFPFGDRNKYHLMSNGEIDYDQIFTSKIPEYDPVWLFPNQEVAVDISDGINFIETSLSIGPFDLPPGGTISIPFAYVAGENFHTDPNNIDNLPYFPENYYLNLDFSDIAKNAQWAKWIYDNPGVDTDGDGYFGEKMICVLDSTLSDTGWVATAADTFFYKGDGIPDWKAAGPPPPPKFWVEPLQYGFRIRFNGSLSETEKDIFTKLADFEGYNVYMGRDDRETSLSLIASFDKHNFDKFIYHPELGRYKVEDIPLTLDELYNLYGENFEPLAYSRTSPYTPVGYPDSLFYFKEHSFNASAFGINTPITRVYPEARDPRLVHPDSLSADDYTSDSLFKYFEYELIVEDLLPTVEYFINVTAFDFGSPKSGLQALESSKSINVESGFPLGEHDYQDEKLNVYVYPNPYRIDATYRDEGYEGRGAESWPDFRVRAINFGNLPPKCTISIYSLDGDLVRRLQHNFSADDPQSHHDHWDLITRNTQMVVSGLYYWVVEAADGQTQMGKLVIIM